MSMTFDPFRLKRGDVSEADVDVLKTNPTALTELHDYWASLPRENGVPNRKSLNPTAMSGLLENCFILEQVAPGVARIRVAGRGVGQLLGLEPRGLPLTAVFLPAARSSISRYLDAGFNGPSTVKLDLVGPRAVGQPKLQGQMLLLPLRDDFGRITRMVGSLVMSGRRGVGGRRFELNDACTPEVTPVPVIRSIRESAAPFARAGLSDTTNRKTQDKPALRLVVSNP